MQLKLPISNTGLHIFAVVSIILLLTVLMLYPFFPGDYESIAVSLSIIIQSAGLLGLLLSIIGICWWLMPRYRNSWALASFIIGIAISLIILLIAIMSVGYTFAFLILVVLAGFLLFLYQQMKRLRQEEPGGFNAAVLYLVFIAPALVLLQLLFTGSLTDSSRRRAMQNAGDMIRNLEIYKKQHGSYPVTLQAQWKDFDPYVVGVEKYHYSPQGISYNLQFEQPRFLLDDFGTREWVVYNPRDEHSSYSHASWHFLLSPQQVMRNQGWYATGNTGYAHWKYFLFD